ncbi:MAG TPA: hypothetical protein VEL47_06120 [Myxococcota bacterium]|nr:hypothetical protein [Myxococcota bacterium]
MKKVVLLGAFFFGNLLAAAVVVPGPTVECRFGGVLENNRAGLDEAVTYVLVPGTGVSGDFDPYEFVLTMYADYFSVEVYLDGDALSSMDLPIANVLALPIGATIFGLSTVYHEEVDEFVALQYECLRAL